MNYDLYKQVKAKKLYKRMEIELNKRYKIIEFGNYKILKFF